MRKLFTLVALMAVTMTASAQIAWGLRGGLNVVNMSLDSDVLKTENKAGWFIGPTLKANIPIINLGVDVSALYDQRTTEYTSLVYDLNGQVVDTDTKDAKRHAINVPINIRYGIGLGEKLEVFAKAGPQFGFCIGDKDVTFYKDAENEDYKQEYKSSEFSLNFGLGLIVMSHLEVAANYNVVCGKTGEVSVSSAAKSLVETEKARTNAWQISACYYF